MNNQGSQNHLTFLPTFTPQQMRLINNLIGHALISSKLAHRLVILREESLAEEFGLTPEIWGHLRAIKAHNLEGFCLHLTELQTGTREELACKQNSMA